MFLDTSQINKSKLRLFFLVTQTPDLHFKSLSMETDLPSKADWNYTATL